ncbi:hypothetical protein JCM8208_006199 [Rhodotorula glutinis]
MSSRGSPIPRELSDPPSSPFQPVLARTTAARRPVVRRPGPPRSTTSPSGEPTRPSTPFGEIGKEHDGGDDNSDVLSLLSGTSGWAAGEGDVDEEAAAFLPRVRDLRWRRPVVRKRTVDVVLTASEVQGGAEKNEKATAGEPAAAAQVVEQRESGPAQDAQPSSAVKSTAASSSEVDEPQAPTQAPSVPGSLAGETEASGRVEL